MRATDRHTALLQAHSMLDKLPSVSVVLDRYGYAWRRCGGDAWHRACGDPAEVSSLELAYFWPIKLNTSRL